MKDDLDFGYPTRLWDAVDESIAHLEPSKTADAWCWCSPTATTPRASSAATTCSTRAREGHDDLRHRPGERLLQRPVEACRTRPDRGLRRLAEETGGGFFELKKKDELGPTFTRVAQELHSQYVLGFSPETLDGKVHKLEVRVKRPGLTARGRKSYVAAPASAYGRPVSRGARRTRCSAPPPHSLMVDGCNR